MFAVSLLAVSKLRWHFGKFLQIILIPQSECGLDVGPSHSCVLTAAHMLTSKPHGLNSPEKKGAPMFRVRSL